MITEKKSILIVEDQFLIRSGIRNIIEKSNVDMTVFEADSVKTAVYKAKAHRPNLIIMDLQLGDGTGAEACRIIHDDYPEIKIVFLSMYDDKVSVFAAMLAGAIGYINKDIEHELLIQAINLALNGFTVFNHKSLNYLFNSSNAQNLIGETSKLNNLSHQQLKVIEFVSKGLTNKEIAREMDLSDNTIRNYLTIIFEKLGISKRTEAAILYTGVKSELEKS